MLFPGLRRALGGSASAGSRPRPNEGKIDEALRRSGQFPASVWDSYEVEIRRQGCTPASGERPSGVASSSRVTTHLGLSNSLLQRGWWGIPWRNSVELWAVKQTDVREHPLGDIRRFVFGALLRRLTSVTDSTLIRRISLISLCHPRLPNHLPPSPKSGFVPSDVSQLSFTDEWRDLVPFRTTTSYSEPKSTTKMWKLENFRPEGCQSSKWAVQQRES